MTYVKVCWKHTSDDQPVEMFSELDADRNERRKVEVFRSGALSYAGPAGTTGDSILGDMPVPSLEEIALDPEFQPVVIDQATFERVWQSATVVAAA